MARIAVRKLADRHGEYGVQVQDSGGSWGPRLLPERRYFPTATRAGRWLPSSLLQIATGAA